MSSAIRVNYPEEVDGVMIVTIDRPPVNAMIPSAYKELETLFNELPSRKDIRCVILTGAGRKAFVAGADKNFMVDRTPAGTLDRIRPPLDCFDSIRRSCVPVIGAINGPAIGGGFMMASCCDFIIASRESRFALPELTIGVPGGVRHINHIVPDRVAKVLALTGRAISATELAAYGGVQEVVEPDEVLPTALRYAADIAAKEPAMVRLTKEALYLTENLSFEEGYRTQQLFTVIAAALSTKPDD